MFHQCYVKKHGNKTQVFTVSNRNKTGKFLNYKTISLSKCKQYSKDNDVSLFFPKESKDRQMYNININSGNTFIVRYQIYYEKREKEHGYLSGFKTAQCQVNLKFNFGLKHYKEERTLCIIGCKLKSYQGFCLQTRCVSAIKPDCGCFF